MEPTTFSALKAMARLGYVRRLKRGDDLKKIYVLLTPKGRRLRNRLVPLAEDVNRIAVRGLRPADIVTTRAVLLAIIENLARDEQAADMRMPSTRELARLKPSGRKRLLRKRIERLNFSEPVPLMKMACSAAHPWRQSAPIKHAQNWFRIGEGNASNLGALFKVVYQALSVKPGLARLPIDVRHR